MFFFCSDVRSRISQGRTCQTSISSELKSNTCDAKSCGTGKRFRISGARALQPSPQMVRMQAKVDGLCWERDRLLGDQRRTYPGTDKVINGPIERRFR